MKYEKNDFIFQNTHLAVPLLLRSSLALGGGGILGLVFSNKNQTPNSFTDDYGDATQIGEIWDGSSFDKTKLQQLFDTITGQENVKFRTLSFLAKNKVTAAQMRVNNLGKDIVIKLGGLDWIPTYLSTDNSGNAILTLWMTNNEQDAFKNLSSDAGLYHGFIEGPETGKKGLYSDWSANWGGGSLSETPSNMYGMSYIRSVTLNNGGKYATSATGVEFANKDPESVFAKFTMEDVEGSLYDYIVEPANVRWQEYGQEAHYWILPNIGGSYYLSLSNENWSPNIPDKGNYQGTEYRFISDSTKYNYAAKGEDNYAWRDDKLWLPSWTEIYYNGGKGLWDVTAEQRKNYDGATESFTSSLPTGTKQSNTTVYTRSWLRSAVYSGAQRVFYLRPSGGTSYSSQSICEEYAYTSYAVRPALHLSLNDAALNAGIEGVTSITWTDFAAEDFKNGALANGETEDDAYQISSAAELALLAKRVNAGESFAGKYFKLTKNIFLARHPWIPIGTSSAPFEGNFDGQRHTIYGLSIESEEDNLGLFGYVSGGTIKNFYMESGIITTTGKVMGSVVANAIDTAIEYVSSNVEIHGTDQTGGLVGIASGTTQILLCNYSGYIYGNSVGGIVGNNGGTISKCTANSHFHGVKNMGTLAAENSGTILNCVAKGTIDGAGNILVGLNSGSVTACFFYGSSTREDLMFSAKMTYCYAAVDDFKFVSTDLDDAKWTEYWAVVPGLNDDLPVQKDLYWAGSGIMSTIEDIKKALEN